MIYHLDEYEPYIRSILKRLPLCYTAQLVRCLINTYDGMDEKMANEVLLAIQRKGYVYLSSDGWAMTKGMYQRIINDRYSYEENANDKKCRLKNMSEKIKEANVITDAIDCFWLVIDLIPASNNFIVGLEPWSIVFDTPSKNEDGKLIQITKIAKNKEFARFELLKSLEDDFTKRFRTCIKRFAIIENEAHAPLVPHIGFTHICVLDPNTSRGYRLVEKRTGEEVWGE